MLRSLPLTRSLWLRCAWAWVGRYARRAYAKPKRILLDGDVDDMQLGQEWVVQVDPNTGKTFYTTPRDDKQTWRRPEAPLDSDFGYGWEPSLRRYIEDPETEHSCVRAMLVVTVVVVVAGFRSASSVIVVVVVVGGGGGRLSRRSVASLFTF